MYNWEKSKSKSNSKYNDPNYPTFSSSFSKKPIKTHHSKSHQNEDISHLFRSTTTTKPPKIRAKTLEDEKMSSIRRACLVEKWMDKRVSDKLISRAQIHSNSNSNSTLLEEFDLFSSSTATNTTTSSSSSDETEYSVSSHPKQKTFSTCFAPQRPKPIKTHSIQQKDENFIKNGSRAAKVYSNLKNLKQPISPGVRLTSFINSLFTKEGKTSTKNVAKQRKTEEATSTSTCSSASSFSRSCFMSKNKNFQDDGMKRTVRFSPVSVIVDDDSQPCGYKSLQEENGNILLNTKFKRSLSKGYEELKKLNGLDREISDSAIQQHQNKLEEVGLNLFSDCWDARLNNSHDLSSKIKGTSDDDYGDNHGVNYTQHENEDEDDDGFSCSSSDLFELDHLSLIGDELPVYETTQFDDKIM